MFAEFNNKFYYNHSSDCDLKFLPLLETFKKFF